MSRKVQDRCDLGPSGRGLSLGLRLGLVTAVSVTVVAGVFTFFQQRREIAESRQELLELFDESLIPLASSLESARSRSEFAWRVRTFLSSRDRREGTALHLILTDSDGVTVATADPTGVDETYPIGTGPGVLYANLPVVSEFLGPAGGMLSVWRDSPSFEAEIVRRWRIWGLEMLLLIASILTAVSVSNHMLVTRPLRRLEQGVQRMGRGYMGVLRSVRGAPEWQRLAHSIWGLGRDLDRTVRSLVEAERQALRLADCNGSPRAVSDVLESAPLPGVQESGARLLAPDESKLRDYLLDKCLLLETQRPDDPAVQAYAREAMERDVLLAERLGDIPLRSRLDDAAFRVLDPDAYERVTHHVAALVGSPPAWLRRREAELRSVLERAGVRAVSVQRRAKHAAGIHRKMVALGIDVENVQDVLAFRLIVADEPDCYRVLAALHQAFRPEHLSFKDYIAHPKPNGYRSIHTLLRAEDGTPFEVQIRSTGMHREAEEGEAAHWRYKEAGRDDSVQALAAEASGVRSSSPAVNSL